MASKFFSNLFGVVDDEPETADYYEDQQPAQQPNSSSKIELVEPRVYGDGKEIVNHLLNGNAVIVNFDQMDAKVAFRIVEYMKGATYAISGKIERIDAEIFLCTPQNFEISGKLAPTLSSDGLDDRGDRY